MRLTTPPEIADQIYAVLVAECAANSAPLHRDAFIHYLAENSRSSKEWRFQGKLGFGGKLYFDGYTYRVGCYPEHFNEERAAIIERTNAALKRFNPPARETESDQGTAKE